VVWQLSQVLQPSIKYVGANMLVNKLKQSTRDGRHGSLGLQVILNGFPLAPNLFQLVKSLPEQLLVLTDFTIYITCILLKNYVSILIPIIMHLGAKKGKTTNRRRATARER
jgi:hypothetical protein